MNLAIKFNEQIHKRNLEEIEYINELTNYIRKELNIKDFNTSKSKSIPLRYATIFCLRKYFNFKVINIGAVLTHGDHSTASTAVKQFGKWVDVDAECKIILYEIFHLLINKAKTDKKYYFINSGNYSTTSIA